MEKKTASIIGIVLGIAIIIVGFCVQGINVDAGGHESYGTPTIGSYIKFGADFYTEMYAVTQNVGDAVNSANKNIHGAVNNAQRNICGAIEKACDAIGWLIVAIGLVDIAYFSYKMASSEEKTLKNTCDFVPTAAVSTMSPVEPVEKTMEHKENKISLATATHKWRCDNCGNMATQSPCEHCGK